MHVLDGEDGELLAAEAADVTRPALVQATHHLERVASPGDAAEPDRPGGRLDHALGLAFGHDRLDRGPQLGERDVRRVVVQDARREPWPPRPGARR